MEVEPGTVRAPELGPKWLNFGPLAPEDAGEDVRFEETGRRVVSDSDLRMYRLARNREFGQRLLQLVSRRPGLLAFAFTFVTCAADDDAADAVGG